MRKVMDRNKRGVSELVSYVLLIGMAISMSVGIYAWIKFRVQKPFADESCPDTLSLIVSSYECSDNIMTIKVQNKGFFNIQGYTIKSSDEETGIAGKSSFDLWLKDKEAGANIITFSEPLKGSEQNVSLFEYNSPIRQIELEPFILKDGQNTYCEKSIATAKVDC